MHWQDRCEEALRLAGFDLLHWGPTMTADPLGDLSRGDVRALLLIGNTRGLWSIFKGSHEARMGATGALEDPLDAYVERAIGESLADAPLSQIRFGHHLTPSVIPIQRIAAQMGAADLGPGGLNAHPIYGPWVSLRAVASFRQEPARYSDPLPATCTECSAKPCKGALQAAQARPDNTLSVIGPVSGSMAPWLAVRDSCPIGHVYRHSDEQLRYHYDKDRGALR